MKKIIPVLVAAILAFSLTACGGGGTQKVSFKGITMEIPANWKADKYNKEDYATYKKTNALGHDYQLQFYDTFSLLDSFDLDGAAKFFKEITEDNASYEDPSEPVAGKLGGKYDMHIIDCTLCYINPTSANGEAKYPCKLIRVYMDGHDVEIQFSAADGDFEAFNAALEGAVCE